jgi:hypothetical protein
MADLTMECAAADQPVDLALAYFGQGFCRWRGGQEALGHGNGGLMGNFRSGLLFQSRRIAGQARCGRARDGLIEQGLLLGEACGRIICQVCAWRILGYKPERLTVAHGEAHPARRDRS